MIDNLRYTNIRSVADRVMQHPMLQHLQFETIAEHAIDFLNLIGFNELLLEAEVEVQIQNNRGLLPSTLVRINQVRTPNGIYLKQMSGTFSGSLENPAFKTQGDVIYTNIKNGTLQINYQGMPVDEEGYPLVPDNVYFLLALEAYIKMKTFTIYFDQGKIQSQVLQQAQQDYGFRVAQLHSKLSLPSVSEMQAISNMWNKMHLTTKDFYTGFDQLTNIDTYKIH